MRLLVKLSRRAGLVALVLAASACAAGPGVDLGPGPVAAEVRQLAHYARAGDKPAQFELGQRFERGEGVPRDLATARVLYGAAAADSGGQIPVWSPGVGATPGQLIFIDQGPRRPGLPAARERLDQLDSLQRPQPGAPADSDRPGKGLRSSGVAAMNGASSRKVKEQRR